MSFSFRNGALATASLPLFFVLLLVLAVFSIAIPSASAVVDATAPVASGLEIKQGGDLIGTIRFGVTYPIDILFAVTEAESSISEVKLDISDLNPMYSYDMTASCSGTNPFTCRLSNAFLNVNSDSANVIVKMTNSDGTVGETTLSYTFTSDNTAPTASFLGTTTCNAGRTKCYIKSGANTLVLEHDSQASDFSNFNIFLDGDSPFTRKRIDSCEASRCTAQVSLTCTERPTGYQLYVAAGSSDDAGNQLTGTLTTRLYCDNTLPEILNYVIRPSSGNEYYATGDTIILKLNVTETGGEPPLVYADFSGFGQQDPVQAACTQITGTTTNWECQAVSAALQAGPYTATLRFYAKDASGLQAEQTESIDVLGFEEGEPTTHWSVVSTQNSPNLFVRQFLERRQASTYAHIRLSSSAVNERILTVEAAECEGSIGDTSISAYLDTPVLLTEGLQTPDIIVEYPLRTTIGEITEGNDLVYVCPILVYSIVGDRITRNPQVLNFTLRMTLQDSGNMAEAVEQEILELRAKKTAIRERLVNAQQKIDMLKRLCNVYTIPQAAGNTIASTAQTIEMTVPVAGQAVANGLTTTVSDPLQRMNNYPGASEIQSMCKFISCKHDPFGIKGMMEDWPLTDELSLVTRGGNFSESMDPEQSFFWSVATLCVPGFIHNLEKLEAINCEYEYCLTNWAKQGMPIDQCGEVKSFNTCKFWAGEAFSVIPYTQILKDISRMATQILTDPATALGFTFGVIAKLDGCKVLPAGRGACQLLIGIPELQTQIQQLMDMGSFVANGNGPYSDNPMGVCDELLGDAAQQNQYVPTDFDEQTLERNCQGTQGVNCNIDQAFSGNYVVMGTAQDPDDMHVYYNRNPNGRTPSYEDMGKVEEFESRVQNTQQGISSAIIYHEVRVNDITQARTFVQHQIEVLGGQNPPDGIYKITVSDGTQRNAINSLINSPEMISQRITFEPGSNILNFPSYEAYTEFLNSATAEVSDTNQALNILRTEQIAAQGMNQNVDQVNAAADALLAYQRARFTDPDAQEAIGESVRLRRDLDVQNTARDRYNTEEVIPARNEVNNLRNARQQINDFIGPITNTQLREMYTRLTGHEPLFATDINGPNYRELLMGELDGKISSAQGTLESRLGILAEKDEQILDLNQQLADANQAADEWQEITDFFNGPDAYANWGNILSVARGFNYISSFIWAPEDNYLWKQWAINKFGRFLGYLDVVDNLENEICHITGYRTPPGTTTSGTFGSQPSMHIESQKSQGYDRGDGITVYDYFVSGAIVPKIPTAQSLNFRIVLKGSGYTYTLIQGALNESNPAVLWNTEDLLTLQNSSMVYDTVCIDINGNDVSASLFFDNPPRNNRLCNRVSEID
ncbi:MAG: hypothetical protein V1659_04965 [Candidatus Woesearchaeota archaeon]